MERIEEENTYVVSPPTLFGPWQQFVSLFPYFHCNNGHHGVKNGFFKRKSKPKLSEIPFSRSLRSGIDKIIRSVNLVLVKNGYSGLPTESYNYFAKTEAEILESFKKINSAATTPETEKYETENSENSLTGSKMLLEQWIRF